MGAEVGAVVAKVAVEARGGVFEGEGMAGEVRPLGAVVGTGEGEGSWARWAL